MITSKFLGHDIAEVHEALCFVKHLKEAGQYERMKLSVERAVILKRREDEKPRLRGLDFELSVMGGSLL